MNIIQKEKEKVTLRSLEPHKVYQSSLDGDFYTLARISFNYGIPYHNCLLNLNTMRGDRMSELAGKTEEFIEVDYTFEISTKD